MIKQAISALSQGRDLNSTETEEVMAEIMSGSCSSAQIAAYLIALKMKGECVEEIIGGTKGILKKAVGVETRRQDLIDLCGTGGDGHSTFNISTVSSIIAAGAGLNIAKHGNRSVSSRCGSADLLEAMGVDLALPPQKVALAIDELGFGFIYAPLFHPAMKYALQPRREIGVRTLFNIIGPLANPLRVKRQLLGVYSEDLLCPVSKALALLGTEKALVVYSSDGLDEISISAPTKGFLVTNGSIEETEIVPQDYQFKYRKLEKIRAFSVEENVRILHKVLKGEEGPERDIALLNSGAAIFVSGQARDIKEGIEMARDSIDSGKATSLFSGFLSFTKEESAKERQSPF
ncbi:MAG: anthranilate phosphoribosyltransferase [Candidatus Aminicenantes bacterium]